MWCIGALMETPDSGNISQFLFQAFLKITKEHLNVF